MDYEKKYNSLLKACPDVIITMNKKGDIIDVHANPDTLILPRESFIEANIKEILTKNQADECLKLIDEAIESDEVQFFPHRQWFNGEMYYFEGRIVRSDSDEVSMIVRDVTAEEQAKVIESIIKNISIKTTEMLIGFEDYFDYLRSQLGRLMDVSQMYISQISGDNEITFQYMIDRTSKKEVPFTRKNGNGLTEYIINTGKPLLLSGEKVEEHHRNNNLDVYGTISQCWIGAPLRSSGKIIGVIACQSYDDPNAYNEHHMKALTAIANEVGLWIEKLNTEIELHQLYQELQLIDKINRSSANNEISFTELLDMTLEACRELTDSFGSRIYLYDQTTDSLNLRSEVLPLNDKLKIEKMIGGKIKSVVPKLKPGSVFDKVINSEEVLVVREKKEIVDVLRDHTDNKILRGFSGTVVKILNLKTIAIFPIKENNITLGLITITYNRVLNEHDVERLIRFTNGIKTVLIKKYAEEKLELSKS